MGQKQIRSNESIIIDRMLLESFKDTDLEFPLKEITKMKLRFKDAENYFGIKFDYFVFFNNYVFHEGLPTLYDNYISKIEQFSKQIEDNLKENQKTKISKLNKKNVNKIFYLFVDFDDETEALEQGCDFEFDSLFTIIFEKLEIDSLTCFSLVNCNKTYLSLFFNQFYESVYFYKTNRKFDALYFLLPNADFFIKNENYVIYMGNKCNDTKLISKNSKTKFTTIIFNTLYFKQLLDVVYPYSDSNNKIYDFLLKINNFSFVKFVFKLKLNYDDMLEFLSDYEKIIEVYKKLCDKSDIIYLFCHLDPIENININQNFANFLKNLIVNMDNSIFPNSQLNIKLINKVCEVKKLERKNSDEENNEKKHIKSRNIFKKNNKLNIIEEESESINFMTMKNVNKLSINIKYNLNQLDKLIQMLLNLSFSLNDKKKKKLLIQYIEITNIQKPSLKNIIQKDLNIFKSEKNKPINITNNLDDEGLETENMKMKTIYTYSKETLLYQYFVSKNEIYKIKITIIFSINKLTKGLNISNVTNLKDKKKIIQFYTNLFEFLFYKKNKYFYCEMKYSAGLTASQIDFEKNLY